MMMNKIYLSVLVIWIFFIATPAYPISERLFRKTVETLEQKVEEMKKRNQPPPNRAPNPPSNPSPPDGATNVPATNIPLSWQCSDPDNDPVSYRVYFEANDETPDVIVSDNQTSTTYLLATLQYNTTYYWQVIAKDNKGNSTAGPVWHFITQPQPNRPPSPVTNPKPEHGTTGQHLNVNLSWQPAVDPDGDTVFYDLYFGTATYTPLPLVSIGQTHTTYDPGPLEYQTTYQWYVVARDTYGNETVGELWSFSTKNLLSSNYVDRQDFGNPHIETIATLFSTNQGMKCTSMKKLKVIRVCLDGGTRRVQR